MSPSRVERLGIDGDGVLNDPEGPIFVRTAVPGDLVLIGKPRRDGKIRRAELKKVLEPSPDRQPGPCAIAARCGGCPLMHASEDLARRFKEGLLRHALGEVPFTLDATAASSAYRTRARLSFDRGALGYLMPGTRTVLDVPRCAVLTGELDRALTWVRERLLPSLRGAGELHLASRERPDAPAGVVIVLSSSEPQPTELYRALEAAIEDQGLIGAEVNVAGVRARFGDPVELGRDVDGRALEVPLGGFRQAHLQAAARLGQAVLTLGAPENERVLELHAGHGNFTLPLASRAASVQAVELGEAAAQALRANIERHALDARVHQGDAASFTAKQRKGSFDLVVLDPPRTGDRALMDPLVKLGAPRILYVSCAPSTLGRDVATLRAGGYQIRAAQAFDLFPRTAHLESVVLLERVSG